MNTVSTVRTVASRVGAKRTMSTTPKMHKAKDVWKQLESTRPPQGHPHVSFRRGRSLAFGGVCPTFDWRMKGDKGRMILSQGM
jgi:hypothetical protein